MYFFPCEYYIQECLKKLFDNPKDKNRCSAIINKYANKAKCYIGKIKKTSPNMRLSSMVNEFNLAII
jgi:hypothetical protein